MVNLENSILNIMHILSSLNNGRSFMMLSKIMETLKTKVWIPLNKVFEYYNKPYLKDEDNESFKKHFKEAWNETSVTHYTVSISNFTYQQKNLALN